jgi:hypothetical protein
VSLKITAQSNALSSKFFHTREFFPLEVNFGDKEKIKITKRPRKTTTEIIDIYANSVHIGMFVGIEKVGKELRFGPTGLNQSHNYRNILDYTFIRLLEYYGLTNINRIAIDTPENPEFKRYLLKLGFLPKGPQMVFDLTDETTNGLLKALDEQVPEIKSQVGQLENVIQLNLDKPERETVVAMVDKIVEKIKNLDPIGKEFWDNRKVMQLNYYISMALLNKDQLVNEEFLEMSIKTIISSLDTFNREPYLEELFIALDGEKPFKMDYIQNMVEKLRELLPKEISQLPKDHLREWVQKNLPSWILNDEVETKTRQELIAQSHLKPEDFGVPLKDSLRDMVDMLIKHYNGEKIFYGVNNRF